MSRFYLFSIVACIVFVGCSSKPPKSRLQGKWVPENSLGQSSIDAGTEFADDGSYKFWLISSRHSLEEQGTYIVKGNEVHITITSEVKNGTVITPRAPKQKLYITSLSEAKLEFYLMDVNDNSLFTYIRKTE